MVDATATVHDALTARALAAEEPTAPVFASDDGRRGRVLTFAGRLAAGIAALWVAALVAGVLGIATPGSLRLPGARSSGDHVSPATGASGAGSHARSVRDRARGVPEDPSADDASTPRDSAHPRPTERRGPRMVNREGRAPTIGAARPMARPGTTGPARPQTLGSSAGATGATSSVEHVQRSTASHRDTAPGSTVSAGAGDMGAASRSRADSAPSRSPAAAPGPAAASTPSATLPRDPGRPTTAQP
jgi:hypothetical protein